MAAFDQNQKLNNICLHDVIKHGNLLLVKLMIESLSINLEYKNIIKCPSKVCHCCRSYTPLLSAIKYRKFDIAEYLIEKGANPNANDNMGSSIIYYACSKKVPFKIFQLLIERGADVNVLNQTGYSPVMGAIEKGDIDKVKYLVKLGSKLDGRDLKNRNVLMIYLKNLTSKLAILEKTDTELNFNLVEYLINSGLSLEDIDNKGRNITFYFEKYWNDLRLYILADQIDKQKQSIYKLIPIYEFLI